MYTKYKNEIVNCKRFDTFFTTENGKDWIIRFYKENGDYVENLIFDSKESRDFIFDLIGLHLGWGRKLIDVDYELKVKLKNGKTK